MLTCKDAFGWNGLWASMAGYEGIFCGLSAVYVAMAQILNETYGRIILPIGEK